MAQEYHIDQDRSVRTIEMAPRERPRTALALAVVSLAFVMVQLDGTVVSISGPNIGRDLGASLSGLQWISNSYLLTISTIVILAGKFGDRIGHQRVFLNGVLLFCLASMLCAWSTSIAYLTALRVAQGLGAAMVLPNGFSILRATFVGPQLPRAIGVVSGCSALPLVVGPIVGGFLVEHVGWQAIFLINVPIGLVAWPLGYFMARIPDASPTGPVDYVGLAFLVASVSALTWGIINTQAYGWGSLLSLGLMVAGVLLGCAFVWLEACVVRYPLLPVRVFRSIPLSIGIGSLVIYAFSFFGLAFFIVLLVQRIQGYDSGAAGIRLLPLTVTTVAAGPAGGFLVRWLGSRNTLVTGLSLASLAFGSLAVVRSAGFGPILVASLALAGLALGCVQVAATHLVIDSADGAFAGSVSGLQGLAVQTGGVLGIALLGSVMNTVASHSFLAQVSAAPDLRTAAAGLPDVAADVPQGIVPSLPGASAAELDAIRQAAHTAFSHGLCVVFVICGCLLMLCSLVVLLAVRRDDGATHPDTMPG
jgi:EmrB/QacA subfamily drug resistance transporter